jgi:hypothetical protein
MSGNSKQTVFEEKYEEGKKRRINNILFKAGLMSVVTSLGSIEIKEGDTMDCQLVETWKNKIQKALLNFGDEKFEMDEDQLINLGISDTKTRDDLMKNVKVELGEIAGKLASKKINGQCILFSQLTRKVYPKNNFETAQENILFAMKKGKQLINNHKYIQNKKKVIDNFVVDVAITLLDSNTLKESAAEPAAEPADAPAEGGRKSRKGRKSRARKTRRKRGKRSRKYRKR